VEEERLNRIKHSESIFPIKSLQFCLEKGNIKFSDIDCIAYGFDTMKYSNGYMRKFYDSISFNKDVRTLKWENDNINLFSHDNIKEFIQSNLIKIGVFDKIPPLRTYSHHLSHAASSYYCSGFDEAITITMDGSGDDHSTVLWNCNNDSINEIKSKKIPHSLGWLYASITEYLGFHANNCEGKVMGLAPYGKSINDIELAFDKLINIGDGDYSINPNYLFYGKHSFNDRFTDMFVDLMSIPPKTEDRGLFSGYENIAFTLQNRLEDCIIELTKGLIIDTGIKNLCLSGGVALNCKANGRIWKECDLDNIFIQPISSDAGVSLGAALLCQKDKGVSPKIRFSNVYLGPEYSDDEIEGYLINCKLKYRKIRSPSKLAAELLDQGKIIGWFQGRMEAGPRSLGSRSILADPRKIEMKDKINNEVKFRDPWRPFCPSVLEDYSQEYFENNYYHPFMIMAFDVKVDKCDKIPAVVHIDNTARPQMVRKDENEKYYSLIKYFYSLTGVPVVLNTSLNIKGEPIVCSPRDAIKCFFGTGLDALIIKNFILTKYN